MTPTGRRWPPVEVVKPGFEGRAPRLVRALGEAKRAFLFSPLPGYGIARSAGRAGNRRRAPPVGACSARKRAGFDASCARQRGAASIAVHKTSAFGAVARERVEEWAIRAASVPVKRLGPDDVPRLPKQGEILVGGPDDVRDFGPGGLDLVAILDADLAERRPGLTARERAVTTWMEAIAWARPDGRAIVQSSHAADPAVQALVRGNPDRFHADETRRRAEAGFPVGSAVFRIAGDRRAGRRARGVRPHDDADLNRRGPDGMLARARPREGAGVRAGGPRARRSTGRRPASRPNRTCDRHDHGVHVILPIRTLGDPVLREPANPVVEFDAKLAKLCDDMLETMYDAPGVGLAGPQVGLSLRLFVFDDGETGPMFMANPELFDRRRPRRGRRLPLDPRSVPPDASLRAAPVAGQDIEGKPYEMTGEGLLARIFQHETDHLDGGSTSIDLDDEGRRDVMAELRRIELEIAEPRRSAGSCVAAKPSHRLLPHLAGWRESVATILRR